jgi:hypothetical protein
MIEKGVYICGSRTPTRNMKFPSVHNYDATLEATDAATFDDVASIYLGNSDVAEINSEGGVFVIHGSIILLKKNITNPAQLQNEIKSTKLVRD